MSTNGKKDTFNVDVVVDKDGQISKEQDANGGNANGAANGNGNAANKRVEEHRQMIDELQTMLGGVGKGFEDFGQNVTTGVDGVGKGFEDFGQNVTTGVGGVGKAAEDGWTTAMSFLWQGQHDEHKDTVHVKAQEAVRKKLGLEPGPDIKLKCIDGMDGKLKAAEINVKWEDSFEDVLRKLKSEFKRDVIFEYEVNGRVIRVHDDESFDRAVALAEGSKNILYCVIQQAAWQDPPMEEPEPEEPEPPEEDLIITCFDRMKYHPRQREYKALLFLGIIGFTVSLITSIIGYTSMGDNGTYLASVSITIPLPYFIHTFTVQTTQSMAATVVKAIVAVSGAAMGLVSLVAYYQLPAGDGIFAAVLWSLSTTFYLWAAFPLFAKYWADLMEWKRKHFGKPGKAQESGRGARKKEKASPLDRIKQLLRALGRFIIEWLWLIVYMLVLGTLQYTPLQHTTNLVALKSKYEALGVMADRGDGGENHIVCRGNPNDGRPVVIMESMEGLGQALAMVKVQERLQSVGIVCAYDRAGFGWSPRSTRARTPENIARELGAMLQAIENDGVEIQVTPSATNANRRSTATTTQIKAGTYGYVLVGHSIGSVYARMFANLFPERTAALVLWDALLTEDTELGVKFTTPQNQQLSAFELDICTKYLEPMGFIDLFMRSVMLTPIINGSVLDQPKPEGLGADYDRMISRMLRREWCPAMKAEIDDLYTGGKPGIFTVVDADIGRYDQPMVVWARGRSVYEKQTYDAAVGPVPLEESLKNYTIEGTDACGAEHTQILDPALNHPEGTSGWQCVQFKALHYSTNPYLNSHKRTCEIIGQPQLGSENPCPDIFRSENGSEIAPLQGPGVVGELANTILDAWSMVGPGYTTPVPSDPIAYTFQGFPPGCTHNWCPLAPEAWIAKFEREVEAVLGARFADSVSVRVIQGPSRCPLVGTIKPNVRGQLAVGDCPPKVCEDANACVSPWQQGGAVVEEEAAGAAGGEGGDGNATGARRGLWGSEEEEAAGREQLGGGRRAFSEQSYYAVFQLVAYKFTTVQAAEEVLSCAEQGANPCRGLPLSAEATSTSEATAALRDQETARRNALFEAYNLSSITIAARDSSENQFTFVNENPRDVIVRCPVNTYKWGVGCRQCPLNATSRADSPDKTACRCDENFFLEVVEEEWTCTRCPPNSQSACGSTLPTDCKCNPGYTGPDGGGCSPCPLNTYKALAGDYNCTACNAAASGCDPERENLEACHAAALTADKTLGTVVHPAWGNISVDSSKWGTNCTTAVPTLGSCVNGSAVLEEADGPSYEEATGNLDAATCRDPPGAKLEIQMENQNLPSVQMQRCVRFGLFGCEVYGNVSLQTWPVESACDLCDRDNELKGICCLAAHLVRPCSPLHPGGSPGHCTEVPALTLLAQGNAPKTCNKN